MFPKALLSVLILIGFLFINRDISLFDNQDKYYDKVIFSTQTDFQEIDITEWKGFKWFYLDGKNQFSTLDYYLFSEPFVFILNI